MVFSSVSFLYFFLPAVLLFYYLVPAAARNTVLLIASLGFYAWGEPAYVIIMIISCLSGYLHGLWIEKQGNGRFAKGLLISSVLVSAGMLLVFKYSDFFLLNIGRLTSQPMPLLRLALPIGISFYTFQIISYTIDVYRKDTPAQKNLLHFATYITFFPQLIAGPIVRFKDVSSQLTNRPGRPDHEHAIHMNHFDLTGKVAAGIVRFTTGLGKKVLLANSFGQLVSQLEGGGQTSVLAWWLTVVAFMLQIYFDFSGYSDMALGLGQMFGFTFPENFRYPLIAASISDFWRRWHISLGSWFRDYVYIPLGGSRCGALRRVRNITLVWLLTGFWHGAAWNFILWGLFFAVALSIEKTFVKYIKVKLPRPLKHVITLFVLALSFAVFYASSAQEAFRTLSILLTGSGMPLSDPFTQYYFNRYALLLVAGIFGATPLPVRIVKGAGHQIGKLIARNNLQRENHLQLWLRPVYILVILLFSTASLVDSAFNPFIYFRF